MNKFGMARTLLSAVRAITSELSKNKSVDVETWDALEDIESVARTLFKSDSTETNDDFEKIRDNFEKIKDVFEVNSRNPGFQFMFSFTDDSRDVVVTFGDSSSDFDVNTAIGILEYTMKNAEDRFKKKIENVIIEHLLVD